MAKAKPESNPFIAEMKELLEDPTARVSSATAAVLAYDLEKLANKVDVIYTWPEAFDAIVFMRQHLPGTLTERYRSKVAPEDLDAAVEEIQACGSYTSDAMDEIIHDKCSAYGSVINNDGLDRQVRYLMEEEEMRTDEIIEALEEQ